MDLVKFKQELKEFSPTAKKCAKHIEIIHCLGNLEYRALPCVLSSGHVGECSPYRHHPPLSWPGYETLTGLVVALETSQANEVALRKMLTAISEGYVSDPALAATELLTKLSAREG